MRQSRSKLFDQCFFTVDIVIKLCQRNLCHRKLWWCQLPFRLPRIGYITKYKQRRHFSVIRYRESGIYHLSPNLVRPFSALLISIGRCKKLGCLIGNFRGPIWSLVLTYQPKRVVQLRKTLRFLVIFCHNRTSSWVSMMSWMWNYFYCFVMCTIHYWWITDGCRPIRTQINYGRSNILLKGGNDDTIN